MDDVAKATKRKTKKLPVRAWLRAIHRDAGYLVVGLTFVYALSGLAVNHVADFTDGDPSFKNHNATVEYGGPIAGDDEAVKRAVLAKLDIRETPREVFRRSDEELEISFDKRSLHVNTKTGTIGDEGQKPRFFLRAANWLHLNRGKKAWTYFADAYAVILIFLATSGMFMLAGKKGLLGRGAVFVGLGVLVPVVYVVLAKP